MVLEKCKGAMFVWIFCYEWVGMNMFLWICLYEYYEFVWICPNPKIVIWDYIQIYRTIFYPIWIYSHQYMFIMVFLNI